MNLELVQRRSAPGKGSLALELRVLLDVARTRLSRERRHHVQSTIAGGLDADRLLALAAGHGLVPLLHHHLGATGELPEPAHERLRVAARESAMLNMALYAELHRLLDALDAAAIPVVPYKGPALAVSLYGNIALREFRDLDLLVRPEDVLRVKPLLLDRGYRPEYSLSEAAERIHLRESCDYQFGRSRGRGVVEVHWALLPRYLSRPMESGCWQRLVPRMLGNRQVRGLASEDLLLYLCGHGTKHGWERLTWLVDVAECVRADAGLDWDRLRMRAELLKASRVLRLSLAMARDHLSLELPDEISSWIDEDGELPRVMRSIANGWHDPRPRRAITTTLMHLATRDTPEERFRYLVKRATNLNEHDWSFVALPESLVGLYYPLRVVRLAGEGLAKMGKTGT